MASEKVDKMDLMLLLLYARDHTGTHGAALHGITRLEKLMFLVEREGRLTNLDEPYEFEPYKFGPFSSDVYGVIEALQSWDLIDVRYRSITDYYESAEVERLDEDLSDEEEDIRIRPSGQMEKPVKQEKIITLTERGRQLAEKLMHKLSTDEWKALTRVKQKYSGFSLRHLIAYVYQTYPETATESELK